MNLSGVVVGAFPLTASSMVQIQLEQTEQFICTNINPAPSEVVKGRSVRFCADNSAV